MPDPTPTRAPLHGQWIVLNPSDITTQVRRRTAAEAHGLAAHLADQLGGAATWGVYRLVAEECDRPTATQALPDPPAPGCRVCSLLIEPADTPTGWRHVADGSDDFDPPHAANPPTEPRSAGSGDLSPVCGAVSEERRPWTDADRKIVADAIRTAIPTATPVTVRILDALADAGRLADPYQQVGGAVIAAHAALLTEAQEEIARLRERVAVVTEQRDQASRSYRRADARVTELEQQMAETEAAQHDTAGQLRDARRQVEQWRARALGDQHGRWELPAPPAPEVTRVWDAEGVQWQREHPGVDRWHCDENAAWESVRTWGALLRRGPLSTTPPADRCRTCSGTGVAAHPDVPVATCEDCKGDGRDGPPAETDTPSATEPAPTPDLMAALRASLEKARAGRDETEGDR